MRYTLDGTDPTATSPEIVDDSWTTIVDGTVAIATSGTLKVRAWKGNNASAVASMPFTVAAPPPNDDKANAAQIARESGVVYGSAYGATLEVDEDVIYPYPYYGGSTWYQWTAPLSGRITFQHSGAWVSYVNVFEATPILISSTCGSVSWPYRLSLLTSRRRHPSMFFKESITYYG